MALVERQLHDSAITNRDGMHLAGRNSTWPAARRRRQRFGGRPQTVRVNSQQRWTDTGITVRAGDVITFQSSGQIQMSDNAQRHRRRRPARPAAAWRRMRRSRQKAGALIAKIGDYSPAFVGDRTTWTAPVSGRLYLGVNDDHLPDNRGEFIVNVGVQGRTLR